MWSLLRRFRPRRDDEMSEEMRFHVDMEAAELERMGMSPAEARRRALANFGGVRRYTEEGREMRMLWLDDLRRDVRYAARSLRRTPGYAIVVVLTLALGIAANTAIFSVANSVVFRQLPYRDPSRLMVLWDGLDWMGVPEAWITGPEVVRLRERVRSFEGVAAIRVGSATLAGDASAEPQQLGQNAVSANFFQLLGQGPDIGRAFAPGDDQPGAARTAIISRRLFTQRFGGDRGVVGKSVVVDGAPTTIIGILPADFHYSAQGSVSNASPDADIYLPLADTLDRLPKGPHSIGVLARVRSDMTVASARAELRVLSQELDAEQYDHRGFHFVDNVLQERVTREVRPALYALLGAVGLLLLIMSLNLAVLSLVRAGRRDHEVTVRRAIGAGHSRVIRQLLTENMLLAALGSGLGLLLGVWTLRALLGIAPATLPRRDEISIDVRVVAVTIGAALLVGIIMGILPAVHAARRDIASVLRERSGARSASRSRRVLVLAQLALSVILLSGTALLLQSFVRLTHVDAGFDPRGVLTIDLVASRAQYASGAPVVGAIDAQVSTLRSLPGVVAAGATGATPLSAGTDQSGAYFPTSPTNTGARDHDWMLIDNSSVTPGYFAAMGIPVLEGSEFTAAVRDSAAARVAIIDDQLAARAFPSGNAVGQPLWLDGDTIRIVGVVRHVRMYGLQEEGRGQVWVPHRYRPYRGMTIVLRTRGEPLALAAEARRRIHSVDPQQAIASMGTMDEAVTASLAQRRLVLSLVAAFAAAALLLAALGVYGVTAASVARRTREFGIRLALGADRKTMIATVVREPILLVAFGLVLGIGATVLSGRVLDRLLYGVKTADALTLFGVALMLFAIAIVASWIPARRAAGTDAMIALRAE
jgi:predicted permease